MSDINNFNLGTNSNLVFIDSNLDNYQSFISSTNNAEVVILDATKNGVEQITQTLVDRSEVQSIQIISHGQTGTIQLGSTDLSNGNLDRYAGDLSAWSKSLAEHGDILLFGCNVAMGTAGVDFVNNLSRLTNADVAASNNLTGSSQLGGDWKLEVTTGTIEASLAISEAARDDYDAVLVSYNGNEYQLTSASLSWEQAQAEAVSLGGNLVTINNAAEETWLKETFGDSERLWIGLTDRDREGEFEWVSGENSSYRNWAAGEPNDYKFNGNFNAGEDYAQMNFGSARQWNDMPNSFAGTFRGIIEIPLVAETFTYQGKEYQLTSGSLSWEEAQAEAVSLGGNLVTINDAAEEAWLQETFGDSERLWIGLTDRDREGEFEWVSGENSSYRNWAAGEPNDYKFNGNFSAGEDYVQMNSRSQQWNDMPNSYAGTFRGIIEIGDVAPNPGTIGLETNTYRVNEGDGTAEVTILRSQGSDGAIAVDYRTVNATAIEGSDYTAVTGTVAFADGETSKTVSIPILDDNLVEGTEEFSFTIDNVTGGATLLAPRTALINIADNDSPNTLTYNGNQYLLTSSQLTWAEAQAQAASLGGNLVTINDAAEEAWLKANFGATEGFWIGINDIASEGNFEWVSGQAVTYTNWSPGEPNNAGGNQDFGWMNFSTTRQWDDNSPTARLRGIIEIGGSNPSNNNGTGNGLRGEYFNNIDFTDSALIRTDSTVNFNWGSGSPDAAIASNTFSTRWTGQIESRYTETYTFRTTTDDGVRLWVNDRLIIDAFIDQAPTSYEGTIDLVAGEKTDIRLEYYENGGGAVARLFWSSDSQDLEIVPQSQLYSSDTSVPVLNNETIVSGLNQPTAIEWTPNGDRFFIAEKGGVIKVAQNDRVANTPFIDLTDRVNGTRDRGLLDIAVHPDFFNGSPYVYALYTYDPPEVFQNTGLAGADGNGNRAARLTRITADANTNFTTAVADSEVVILGTNSTWDNFNAFANSTFDFDEAPAGILPDGTNLQDFLAADSESHTIGSVEFGPDGALYVSNGDGTSYNRVDPRTARVQDIDNLSGKIIRIDPITGDGLADNPFYNGDPDANRSKVYQLGLRNPFRMTIDPRNGDVFVGDVGWTQWEEINSAGAGANFGWPYYEGGSGTSLRTGGYQDLTEAQNFYNSGQSVDPSVLALNHRADGINAIVLGDIYTGNAFPEEYRGDLFFSDLGRGIVYNASFDGQGNVSFDTFTTGANIVVQIIEAPDGSLYYVDLDDGTVGRWFFS